MDLLIVSSINDIDYVKEIKKKTYIVSGFTSVSNFFKKKNFICKDLNEFQANKKKQSDYLKLVNDYYQLFNKNEEKYILFRSKYLYNYIGFINFSEILTEIIKKKKKLLKLFY